MPKQILELSDLCVRLTTGEAIVEDVSFDIGKGEILALVGESGSGKSTTALSLLGYASPGARIQAGDLAIVGQRVPIRSSRSEAALRDVRGRLIAYVPQAPATALNPSLRVSGAVEDVMGSRRGGTTTGDAARNLDAVGLRTHRGFLRRFPHELSGGQQQRVCIAMALARDPAVLVLDEPTTGLDVITQARILQELLRLRMEKHLSMLYVTHDLAVVAQIADRVAVMYGGRIIEQGAAKEVLTRPRHPYTRGLLASLPDHVRRTAIEPMPGVAVGVRDRRTACPFAPRCPQRLEKCERQMPPDEEVAAEHMAACFDWANTPPLSFPPSAPSTGLMRDTADPVLEVRNLRAEHETRGEVVIAADNVSFRLASGECLALVGESGSGKTTIARAIAGLQRRESGQVLLHGETLPALARQRTTEQRRSVQLVFQSPGDALNPHHTVRSAIARPARQLRGLRSSVLDQEVDRLLDCVRLSRRIAQHYPADLSGGEKQRVAIARALAANPDVLICDEVTSALDVSVQAAVLTVLNDLRTESDLSILFITHNLGIVGLIADRVLVLENGVLQEEATALALLSEPHHPYTQRLIEAAPSMSTALGRPAPYAPSTNSATGPQRTP